MVSHRHRHPHTHTLLMSPAAMALPAAHRHKLYREGRRAHALIPLHWRLVIVCAMLMIFAVLIC
jgi:hypothetical protein